LAVDGEETTLNFAIGVAILFTENEINGTTGRVRPLNDRVQFGKDFSLPFLRLDKTFVQHIGRKPFPPTFTAKKAAEIAIINLSDSLARKARQLGYAYLGDT
jgi:hypothetical protein